MAESAQSKRLAPSEWAEEERRAQKKAERERKRQEAREAAEKKKRFALTPEKKRKLRLLIMKMATENRKNAAEQRLTARKHYIAEHVQPLPVDWQMLDEVRLQAFVRELHQQLATAEETRYDLEMTIRRQDYQINELTIRVNDIKGKFIKPTLKKISRTGQKVLKFKDEESTDFRVPLKSSSNKFALKDDEPKNHFREQIQLKSSKVDD